MDALLRRRVMMSQGGEPPGPRLVFYDKLVFDGTAYIVTDIVFPANCSIRVVLGGETLESSQRVFHAWSGSGTGSIYLVYGGGTSQADGRQLLAAYDSTSYAGPNNFFLPFRFSQFTYFATPYRYGYGDQVKSYTKGNQHPSGPIYLGHSSALTGNPYTGFMGQFSIYGSDASGCMNSAAFDNYTPIYTLRPCTFNGEAGMWCVETSTFYGNSAGAGTLSVLNNS